MHPFATHWLTFPRQSAKEGKKPSGYLSLVIFLFFSTNREPDHPLTVSFHQNLFFFGLSLFLKCFLLPFLPNSRTRNYVIHFQMLEWTALIFFYDAVFVIFVKWNISLIRVNTSLWGLGSREVLKNNGLDLWPIKMNYFTVELGFWILIQNTSLTSEIFKSVVS